MILDEITRTHLCHSQKREKNRRRYVKITVILMLDSDFSVQEITLALGIDDNTVYRYQDGFEQAANLEQYLQDQYVPCQSNLTAEQLQTLKQHLKTTFYTRTQDIAAWIDTQFVIDYTPSGVRHLLKQLGFVFKQSKLIPLKQDIQGQNNFVQQITPLLENPPVDTVLLYSNAVHPQHNSQSTHGWIEKGKEFFVRSTSGKKRLNLIGVVNAHNVTDFVVKDYQTINSESVIAFYKEVESHYAEASRIIIVEDNARYYHSELVLEYLKTSRIQVKRLPAYSPNLNLIERVWKYFKQVVTRNKIYGSFKLFKEAVFGFFDEIEHHRQELKSLLTLNFHIGV